MNAPEALHNDEAERSLLGGVLVEPERLAEVAEHLRGAGDFYREAHARIWAAMVALDEKGETPDTLLVSTALQSRGELAGVGGPVYISQLMDGVPRLASLSVYAREVREKALKRANVKAIHELMPLAAELESDAFLERFRETADGLASGTADRFQVTSGSEAAEQWLDEAERRQANPGEGLIKTGFADTDDKLGGGFERGDYCVIGANTSVGKSALVTGWALNMAAAGHEVGFISLEMSPHRVMGRLLAGDARVNATRARMGTLADHDWARLVRSLDSRREAFARLHFSGSGSDLSLGGIRHHVREVKRRAGRIDVLVVDYLQLVRGGNWRSSTERVAAVSSHLKALALEHELLVIAPVQCNRDQETATKPREHQLSDICDSAQPGKDADVVAFLRRPGLELQQRGSDISLAESSQATLRIVKMRSGSLARVDLEFDHDRVRFEEAVPRPRSAPAAARGERPPF